jgi:hypothetical protein
VDTPSPRGADLISQLWPFDHTSLKESVSSFLHQLEEYSTPVNDQSSGWPYRLVLVAAVAALEVTRRWRKRVARSKASRTTNQQGSMIHRLS